LAARGERVRVLDVWRDPSLPGSVEFIDGDVRDTSIVAQAMAGIDIVHHAAALVPLTKAGREFWEVNVDGSSVVAAEAARAAARAFVHISSSAVFGVPQTCPITDMMEPKPIEPYGRSKLAGERVVQETCNRAGIPLIVVRPRTILGPRRMGIFQLLFEWIRTGQTVYIIGTGEELFQFIHAQDLMEAYFLLLNLSRTGTYNIGTTRFGTLRDAIENLVAHAEGRSRILSIPPTLAIPALRLLDALGLSPLAPWHYMTLHKPFYFDTRPITEIGWEPKYSNDEMFREAYDTYLEAINCPGASPHRKALNAKALAILRRFPL